VLNAIFIALIAGAVATAAVTGTMAAVNQALLESAKTAVNIALGLIGTMALWLGFMRVLRDAGVMRSIARGLSPLMRSLFPDVPVDHPAMSAMILNMAANMLGMGNAATPFGLKAMRELQKLNPRKAVATDSMALFLAINTSGVAVMPLGVIAIRSSLDSANAGAIFIPSMLATFFSTLTGLFVAKLLARSRMFAAERYPDPPDEEAADGPELLQMTEAPEEEPVADGASRPRLAVLFGLLAVVVWAAFRDVMDGGSGAVRDILNSWLMPTLALVIVLYGFSTRIKVYEAVVAGAREGFQIVILIIPFLVAILVAVGMFRASGALDAILTLVAPATAQIGFPAEALPMALLRPLSASGAMGIMTETMQTYGPDSFVGYLVSVLNGSTETTFYVLAVYFGSIRIRITRYTVLACLSADVMGVLAALFWCRVFF
jgi:spore maturation protein SpmA